MSKKKKEGGEDKAVPELNTKQVMKALRDSHDPRIWAFFEEVRVGTGFGGENEQRLDAWAIAYGSKVNSTRCYELKVSRSDFLSETKKPLKKRPGLRLSKEFLFVTPKNLIDVSELPPECGLIEVDSDGNLHTTVKPPVRDILPPTFTFLSSILRRLDRDRLYDFIKTMGNEELVASTGNVMLEVIEQHINKWENAMGNKEIPLKIAESFRVFRNDVIDELIKQKIYK